MDRVVVLSVINRKRHFAHTSCAAHVWNSALHVSDSVLPTRESNFFGWLNRLRAEQESGERDISSSKNGKERRYQRTLVLKTRNSFSKQISSIWSQEDSISSLNWKMSYAYLFKYIIIGDTGMSFFLRLIFVLPGIFLRWKKRWGRSLPSRHVYIRSRDCLFGVISFILTLKISFFVFAFFWNFRNTIRRWKIMPPTSIYWQTIPAGARSHYRSRIWSTHGFNP